MRTLATTTTTTEREEERDRVKEAFKVRHMPASDNR